MLRYRISLVLLAALNLATTAGAARVRVTGDRVNLRAIAKATAETVAQASTGDELQVLSGLDDEWVQVKPPPKVDFWIFAELVQGGQVVVSKAQVRAGAGLNFNVVGSLRRGAAVQDRGRIGDWLKIAPPEGTSLWISREYVEPLAESAPAIPSAASVAIPAIQPIAPPSSAPATPAQDAPAPLDAPPAAAGLPAPDPRYPEVPAAAPAPAASSAAEPQFGPSAAPETRTTSDAGVAPRPTPLQAPPKPLPPLSPGTAETAAGWERQSPPPEGASTFPPPAPVRRVRPRVLFPQQTPGGGPSTVGPANIPADRLSSRHPQGNPGSYQGQLAGSGAIFYTPGRHRIVTLNRAGRAVTLCYVLGNERQLNSLLGSRLIVEGPIYWFRSTQYPTVLAEKIHRLP